MEAEKEQQQQQQHSNTRCCVAGLMMTEMRSQIVSLKAHAKTQAAAFQGMGQARAMGQKLQQASASRGECAWRRRRADGG